MLNAFGARTRILKIQIFRMIPVLVFTFLALCSATPAKKPYVEPDHLNMLLATGQDEEFARLMGIDVSLVRPQEGRSEEDLIFNKVSELGDILLTPEQEEQARQGVNFQRYPGSKWQNSQIPYVIASSGFTSAQRTLIERNLSQLSSRTQRLKVVKRTTQQDYVMVISGNGCYSNLGRVGGAQTLSLQSNGCLSNGTIQHEFIHAAGFTHEHNRPDRDNSVTVLFENIPAEWRSQYEKVSEPDFGNQATYDYYSVMHYPIKAPGSNLPAFELKDNSIDPNRLGQRDGPTNLDIQKINELYPLSP